MQRITTVHRASSLPSRLAVAAAPRHCVAKGTRTSVRCDDTLQEEGGGDADSEMLDVRLRDSGMVNTGGDLWLDKSGCGVEVRLGCKERKMVEAAADERRG
ncbi:putative ectopic P granules protein 5-like protein [Sesbania bispinosa]|nr:putative ectopic P granules protein 5-like protein [Sesbania bispinosa]